jgi:hypothetical protein
MPAAVVTVMRPTTTATTATMAVRMGLTTAVLGVRQQHGLVCGDDDAGRHGHAGGGC